MKALGKEDKEKEAEGEGEVGNRLEKLLLADEALEYHQKTLVIE